MSDPNLFNIHNIPGSVEIIEKQQPYNDDAPTTHDHMTRRKRQKQRVTRRPSSNAYKKKNIPSALRTAVWLTHNQKHFEAKCYVSWCTNTINVFNFEAGHDIPESKGGKTTLDNLRPICSACNKSMGNMYSIQEFSSAFAPSKKRLSWYSNLFQCWRYKATK